MILRTFVASASLALLASTAAFAQTPSADKLRTEDLVKQAVDRYNDNLRAAAQARVNQAQEPSSIAIVGASNVPMTLEEAVRRAIDSNLELAVERLNPQTFDLTLASLRANYKPVATSSVGRRDNVRPPTSLLNPGSPNVSTDDVQLRDHAEHALGRWHHVALVQQQQSPVAQRPAGVVRSPVQQLVPVQLHAAAASGLQNRSDTAADEDDDHQSG
jgi:hypothetical protein